MTTETTPAPRVVDLRRLHPAARDLIAALIEADAESKGDSAGVEHARSIRARGAEWDHENEIEAKRETLARACPGNPYLRDGLGGSSRRNAYLYGCDRWRQRSGLAHDLRTSTTRGRVDVPTSAKRRYQWAESSFLSGYLPASSFLREARLFDDAVAALRDYYLGTASRYDWPIATKADANKEERRLRRLAINGELDKDRWRYVHRRRKEMEENENQWRLERRHRTETAFQMLKLREGRVSLSAIRALLRGVGRSQRPASRPARTSPTS